VPRRTIIVPRLRLNDRVITVKSFLFRSEVAVYNEEWEVAR